MIRQREAVFVDSGAWIALALSRDPLHPVVIETFTFLDRNANRDVALAWKEWVTRPGALEILLCELRDLQRSWEYFRRSDLHKLSAVDATSFVIMKRARIRLAYTFDHHFAVVGFRMVT